MTTYTARQGDHLASIAESFGFHDYSIIWDHPDNEDLRTLREDPNVIAPGDEIVIPEIETREEDCQTEQRHRFRLHSRQLSLRLRLLDVNDQPIADLPCRVRIESTLHELTSDADGFVQTYIPHDAETGRLSATDPDRAVDIDEEFRIGHLDPAAYVPGITARLVHLGYEIGDDLEEPDEELLSMALEEFQCNYGLEVTGEINDATRDKLVELHGA